MPKVSKRRCVGHAVVVDRFPAVQVAEAQADREDTVPPGTVLTVRKVSFEDGTQQQDTSTTTSSGSSSLPPNRAVMDNAALPLLQRKPTPSVSLTELFVVSEDSPKSTMSVLPLTSSSSPPTTDSCSSPAWGQFVDVIVVPDDDDDATARHPHGTSTGVSSSGGGVGSTSSYHHHPYSRRPPLRIRKSKTCMNGFLLTRPSTTHDTKTTTTTIGVETAMGQLRMSP